MTALCSNAQIPFPFRPMEFTKIKIVDKGVELHYTDDVGRGTAITKFTSKADEQPTPVFVASLRAFKAWALDLIGLPTEWFDGKAGKVSGISLSRTDDGRRGLIVTLVGKVPKAQNRPVVINTPLVNEGGENTAAEVFVLEDEELALITDAEKHALAFLGGERAPKEQTDAFEQPDGTTSDQKAADPVPDQLAEKRKKRKAGEPVVASSPNTVINPDHTKPPTDETIRQLLLSVDRDVAVDTIAGWSSTERDQAQRWAMATLDSRAEKTVLLGDLIEPDHVTKAAANDLWDTGVPPKVTQEAAVEITAAVSKG